MPFTKETNTNRWDKTNISFSTAAINWDGGWSKEQVVDPRAYAFYTTNWNNITMKWNELT